MGRGRLRIYLGAAPGVGKTVAMLDEGHRRAGRGTDVIVGFAETHQRVHTSERLEGLEVVPRKEMTYRGAMFTEMDTDAVLARHPQVALVDELAHTNVPGSLREKRWQDVELLLEAGIDVISTVNIQHLESVNDVVEAITGVPQRETVPDSVVRAADQVELVDMTAEALRRRMAHGNIYAAEKVDAALSNYFRAGNLTALRELALLWLADSVDEGLQRYRELHGIDKTWETRERVVVALTGGLEGETLLRRGARIAARATGGELLAVHVARGDGLAGVSVAALASQRVLTESLGGSFHSVIGDDIPQALLDFARAHNATQIVVGASRRSALRAALTGAGVGATVTRMSGPIDVHMVGHDYVGRGRVLPHLGGGLSPRRRLAGAGCAVILLGALTPVLAALRHHATLASDALSYLVAVVIVAVIGGLYPALAAAVASALLINWYFTPPLHSFTIHSGNDVVSLIAYVIVAALVSSVVDAAARRSREAARAGAEAETLFTLAGSLLRGEQALPALLDRVQETFAMESVSLLRRDTPAPASETGVSGRPGGLRGSWTCVASVGHDPCLQPGQGDIEVPVADDLALVLRGRALPAEDRRVLAAFAAEVAVAYQQRQLREAAAAAVPAREADRMRTALLNAVSHDLRSPLAIAKATVSSLRSEDVAWEQKDRQQLLASADAALDRLTDLVTNLLDLSRLQAGMLSVFPRPLGLDEVVSLTVDHLDAPPGAVVVDVPLDLPEVNADAGLLDRVIANLVQNALRYSAPGVPVRLAGSSYGDPAQTVELRVIDRGPGILEADREAAFAPFQRRDDRSTTGSPGVGLGLAIARGFTEAMKGSLTMEDTPGGGLTVVISLPAVASQVPSGAAEVVA